MKVITVINQKGGVGKTATANALGAGLIRKGYSVLRVDLDAQGNLTYSMGNREPNKSSLKVLIKGTEAHKNIATTDQGELIPFNFRLSEADTLIKGERKEYRLKDAVSPLEAFYDYVIIDTPPALGICTINALTASDVAVIPAEAKASSLQGINQVTQTIQAVKEHTNPNIDVLGVLFCRHNGRTVLSRDMVDMVTEQLEPIGCRPFETCIRENTAIAEAEAVQEDIFTYSPKSNGAKDYRVFVDEFIDRMEKGAN